MIYLYDGSYQGFLSVVYANYYEKRGTEVLTAAASPGLFLDEYREITTDPEKAVKVERALWQKCGRTVTDWLYYAFHSAEAQKDSWLLRFVERAFQLGMAAENALALKEIRRIVGLAKRVSRERHSFLGFVRFEEIGYGEQSCLYARITPQNDILELMGGHFAERFYKERIVIHDVSRNMALVAYRGRWELRPFAAGRSELRENRSPAELVFQKLWQGYFEYSAVEERRSSQRQKQHVPLKYRPNLTEFQNAGERLHAGNRFL